MNIAPINNNIGNYNNNIGFKSKLEPTPYLKELLEKSIMDPRGQSKIVDGIRRVLNDGKNDIIRLDYAGKFAKIFKTGGYKITVNGEKKLVNYHNIGGGITVQGRFALEEIYRDQDGNLIPCEDSSIMEEPKLAMFRKRIQENWKRIFDEYDYGTGDEKKIKNLHKNMEFLKNRYNLTIKQELIKLKNEIFKNA